VADRRLSWDQRHAQLLDTAATIVRSDGADALTLARVAEAAGVSRPVAYEHFETRGGLLTALYRRIDDQQTNAVRAAVEQRAGSLPEAAALLARAYVECTLHIGGEFGAVTAALSASTGAEEILRAGRERYVELYLEAIERFAPLPAGQRTTLMLGVIGAAETLARETIAGRVAAEDAVAAITCILLGVAQNPHAARH
jgi:AcrR family transcriptional regulator